jgi:hypothetical protein
MATQRRSYADPCRAGSGIHGRTRRQDGTDLTDSMSATGVSVAPGVITHLAAVDRD